MDELESVIVVLSDNHATLLKLTLTLNAINSKSISIRFKLVLFFGAIPLFYRSKGTYLE